MTTCHRCGRQITEGAWVCGLCGEPVGAFHSGDEPSPGEDWSSPTIGESQPFASSTAAPPARDALPRRTPVVVLALGIGLAAVLAVIAVWFFALRGDAVDIQPFLGAWQSTGGDAIQVTFDRAESGVTMTLGDGSGQSVGPFKVEATEDNLQTKLELLAVNEQTEAAAQILTATLEAAFEDFKMTFTHRQVDDTVVLAVEGAPKMASACTTTAWSRPIELVRVR
ncbi:MAG: hypothetical protein GX537_09280 [Actinobacteria bacterium]|nr:hypothetical protein [Actinomycetota bacterium]